VRGARATPLRFRRTRAVRVEMALTVTIAAIHSGSCSYGMDLQSETIGDYTKKLSSTVLSNAIKRVRHIKFSRMRPMKYHFFGFGLVNDHFIFQSPILNVAKTPRLTGNPCFLGPTG